MKKCLLAVLVSGLAYSQVGINTSTPQATLDIVAKTTDGTKPEGLIAPRLTGAQLKEKDNLYLTAQKGALVFVTTPLDPSLPAANPNAPSAKTINVTTSGYYFYDADETNTWIKLITFPSSNYYSLGTAASIEGTTQNIDPAVTGGSPSIVYLEFPVNRYSSPDSGVTLDATNTIFTFNRAGTYQITATTEIQFGPATVWNIPAATPGDFWMDVALWIDISHDNFVTWSRSNVVRHTLERDNNGGLSPQEITASLVPVITLENISPGDQIRVGVRRGAGANRASGDSAFARNSNIIIQNLAR